MNDRNIKDLICPFTSMQPTCDAVNSIESKYKRILRHSWEEIYVFTPDLKFLEVSVGALANLGYTWEEMQHLTVIDVKAFLSLAELTELVQPLIHGTANIINCQTTHKRKNGSTYEVNVRLQFVPDKVDPVFIAMVTDVTERNRYEDELRALAFRDPGTELYNKRFFLEQLGLTIDNSNRRHASVGLVLIDMDDFSTVNNTYGHLAGDKILNEFARKIKTIFSRKSDIVARYGGDEFVVLCVDTDEEILRNKCDELIARFNSPVNYEGKAITQTASIGLCLCSGALAAVTKEDLISGADGAMYEAKDAGKNAVRVCRT